MLEQQTPASTYGVIGAIFAAIGGFFSGWKARGSVTEERVREIWDEKYRDKVEQEDFDRLKREVQELRSGTHFPPAH
jgi:hypothetical protein